MANTLNLDEIKNTLNYLIDNNFRLKKEGRKMTTICLRGEAGIGKTAVLEEIANERNMTYKRIILSQFEEQGDLLGYPIKEYRMITTNSDGTKTSDWVSSDLVERYNNSPCGEYEFTNESRLGYAQPAWLPADISENGVIINFDDMNRANPTILTSLMEVIDKQEFMSWNLPEKVILVASMNPDDGKYSVTSLDSAFLTRMITFDVEFNVDVWARWAEYSDIDQRAVNFALFTAEQLFKNDGVTAVNARSYTTFCNAISGIKDWESTEGLAMILNISKGCFDDKNNTVGRLFTSFVSQHLDKLITPKDMLSLKWDTLQPKLQECVGQGSNYRADVAAVLSTRLLNYICKLFDTKGGVKSEDVCKRLIEFVDDSKVKSTRIFSDDLIFNICKTLVSKYPARVTKLMMNANVRAALK